VSAKKGKINDELVWGAILEGQILSSLLWDLVQISLETSWSTLDDDVDIGYDVAQYC